MTVVATTLLTGPLLLAGCWGPDAMCSDGEYPVLAVNSTTGGACVPVGEQPPRGYVRHPDGKVPRHEGDSWDTYWDSHMLDESGREVPA